MQRWALCITNMLPEKCQSKSCSVPLTLSSQWTRSGKTLEDTERMKGHSAALSFAAQLLVSLPSHLGSTSRLYFYR